MKKSLIVLVLLAGCGRSEPEGGNTAAAGGNASAPAEQAAQQSPARTAVATAGLTGLFEGGSGQQRSQLCVIDRGSGNAKFGITVWGANMHSCSGSGQAVRSGDTLTLTMDGDSTCRIEARMEGGTVTLPQTLPAGCSYYCGARARFSGATLTRRGTTAADAMKAKDLAGDPLCEG
jgi:hypothetical protein